MEVDDAGLRLEGPRILHVCLVGVFALRVGSSRVDVGMYIWHHGSGISIGSAQVKRRGYLNPPTPQTAKSQIMPSLKP